MVGTRRFNRTRRAALIGWGGAAPTSSCLPGEPCSEPSAISATSHRSPTAGGSSSSWPTADQVVLVRATASGFARSRTSPSSSVHSSRVSRADLLRRRVYAVKLLRTSDSQRRGLRQRARRGSRRPERQLRRLRRLTGLLAGDAILAVEATVVRHRELVSFALRLNVVTRMRLVRHALVALPDAPLTGFAYRLRACIETGSIVVGLFAAIAVAGASRGTSRDVGLVATARSPSSRRRLLGPDRRQFGEEYEVEIESEALPLASAGTRTSGTRYIDDTLPPGLSIDAGVRGI